MVAFLRFRRDMFHVIFSNEGDGLKNIFNLVSYVKEPITAEGIFKFNSFCYPFGEYVYYTDNTPLFAIPFRWFCLHIYDASAYTMVVFNLFVILNIIISGLLLYKIFRQLLNEQVFSYIIAIILPWTNIQVLRIWRGHYSLSFASLILLAIWLMMLWHKYRYEIRKQVGVGVAMILLTIASFLAHGYYLAIVSIFITFMLLFYGFLNRKEKYGKFTLWASVVFPVLAVGLTMLLLFVTDKNLAIRGETAHGYDDAFQKTRLFCLYGHYNFQKIFFPIYYDFDTSDPDSAGYLGNVGLFAFFIIGIAVLVNKRFRYNIMQIQKDFFRDPLKASILLGSIIMLSISMGEVYDSVGAFYQHGFNFFNIINPFFYLHFITNRVEQFRCLVRFLWPFYFGFYIWVMYTIVAVYQQSGKRLKISIIVGICCLGGAEVYDFVTELQHKTNNVNYLSADNVAKTRPGHLDPKQYQAILPIPYYFVGSEDYNMTSDDDEGWSNYTYRLHLNTGLPLMSCKMSRTPPLFNKILFDFVAYDSLNKLLKEKLNRKPILVAVNKRLINEPIANHKPILEQAVRLYTYSLEFVARHHLQPVDSADDVIFYNYYPE